MKIPKTGNTFPTLSNEAYKFLIGRALSEELGNTGRAVKTVQSWTNANERTVKNWFSGHAGPQGEHLVLLMRHSDKTLQFVLDAAGRQRVATAACMLETAESIERLQFDLEALRKSLVG